MQNTVTVASVMDMGPLPGRGYTAVRRPYNFRPYAASMRAEQTAATTSTIARAGTMSPMTIPTTAQTVTAAFDAAAAAATLAAVYAVTSPVHNENGSLDNTVVYNASGSRKFVTPETSRSKPKPVTPHVSVGERGPKVTGPVRVFGPPRRRQRGFQTSYKTWTNRRKKSYARKKV